MGPRDFDPVALGNAECDAWVAYYRREWRPFLKAAVGMVRIGFGMPWPRTIQGAWYVLRANQVWAPYPDNDPTRARDFMRDLDGQFGAGVHLGPLQFDERGEQFADLVGQVRVAGAVLLDPGPLPGPVAGGELVGQLVEAQVVGVARLGHVDLPSEPAYRAASTSLSFFRCSPLSRTWFSCPVSAV